MYGWIADGISSLFEPVRGESNTEWSEKTQVSAEGARRASVQLQEKQGRPAKRSYQSVHVTDGVCQSEPVEVKRRRRDVVISFVKKTVAGLAGLLRRRKPLPRRSESQHEESQPVKLMGIDEIQSSWLTSSHSRMDKFTGAASDRSGQSSVPPLIRKYSGTAPPSGFPDRGNNRERRGSLQLLPSRPAVRVADPDPPCMFVQNRSYRGSLTVEEAIKQNNKEHYRRLLEMVTEKYSKNQPLPFTQTKPHDECLLVRQKPTVSERTFSSVCRRTGCTESVETKCSAPYSVAPTVFSSRMDRWNTRNFHQPFSRDVEDSQPATHPKQAATELDLSTEVALRLNLTDRDTLVPEISETHPVHIRISDADIPRLTKEMGAEVSKALAHSDPNLVLSSAFKLRITQRDLATLREGGWLNDEVINFYLSLIMEQSFEGAGRLKVYSFSTFFLPKLQGGSAQVGGHAAVKRWTKTIDLFDFDLVLVPLHLGVHWALAVIDLKSKTVKSYDSMGQRHDEICALLLAYLKEEHRTKKCKELDSAKWTLGSMKASEIPQQTNGSDCGVFVCKYAEYISKGRALSFRQAHMPLFRKVMMWEILNQRLL